MYAAVLPAVWVIQLYDRACAKRNLRALLSYLPVFGALYGAFLLFRFWYFHDWVPNTYYAKGGPSLRTLLEVALFWPAHTARTHALFSGVAGPLGMFVWVLLCGGTIWAMAGSKDYKKEHFVPFAFLICSMAVYLLLPEDGAGEYRYATPFFVLVYVYLFVLADLAARQTIPWVAARQLVFLGFTLAVMGGSVMVFSHRSEKWARSPCVPMEKIAFEALRFDRYSALLGIKASSVLLPDVGGTLYHSSYRVVDLAGLCDRTVARTLRRDTAAFHEYIFGKVKPTFIHTHTDWSYLARLDDDPRFRRDYIPIWETPFRFMNDSVGVIVYSGDYVRRDLVNASPEIMAALAAGPGRFSPGK